MKRILVLGFAAVALVAAGCGSSNSSSSNTDTGVAQDTNTGTSSTQAPKAGGGGASSSLKLAADPSGALKFDKSKLAAKAGNVSIVMTNPSAVPHGVALEGNGVDTDGPVVDQGKTSTVKANLKAGTYTFYCPVPGHRQAGMEGTLTVK